MSRSTMLVAIVLCGAAAFAAGWFLKPRPDAPDASGEAGEAGATTQPATGQETGRAKRELATIRTEIEGERMRRLEAEAEIKRLHGHEAALEEPGSSRAEGLGPAAGKARFAYKVAQKALDQIDWKKAGEAVAHMVPLLAEWGRSIAAGKPSTASIGEISRWNGPLVNIAMAAQNSAVPGTGVNGAFSHPAIQVNLVHATLSDAGLALDAAQEQRLFALGTRFVDEETKRLAGYDKSTFALQKTIEESELKERFYEGVDGILSTVQRRALHADEFRGRLSLDLFSSGIMWLALVRPAGYRDRAELARQLARQAARQFQIGEDHQAMLGEVATEYARGFSTGFIEAERDKLDEEGRFRIDRVLTAARQQLVFYRTLVGRLPVGAKAAALARAESGVLLPIRKQ